MGSEKYLRSRFIREGRSLRSLPQPKICNFGKKKPSFCCCFDVCLRNRVWSVKGARTSVINGPKRDSWTRSFPPGYILSLTLFLFFCFSFFQHTMCSLKCQGSATNFLNFSRLMKGLITVAEGGRVQQRELMSTISLRRSLHHSVMGSLLFSFILQIWVLLILDV